MSDESNKQASSNPASPDFKNPQPTMEVAPVGTVDVVSFDGRGEGTVTQSPNESSSMSFGGAREGDPSDLDPSSVKGLEGEASEGEEGNAQSDEEANTEDRPSGDQQDGDDVKETPLPAFTMEDASVLEAYDKKYTHEVDGKQVINLNAFNASLAASQAETGKPDITADERAYLKANYGITDKVIDDHIEGLVRKAEAYDNAIKERFDYDAAIKWAKAEKGYTPEQKARFNDALKKFQKTGDHSVLDEQIDLLEARYAKANPGAKTSVNPGVPFKERVRRPSSPEKVASPTATQAPKGEPMFKNTEEHRVAQNEAIKSGDPKQIEAVRRRLVASMKQDNWA